MNSYGNQVEVGEGLHKALKEIPGLKREDIFIVSVNRVLIHPQWSRLTKILVDLQAVEHVCIADELHDLTNY